MITRDELCPGDAMAESLIAAFDPSRLAASLSTALPDWKIASAKIVRAKYKPDRKALLSVVVQCQGGIERRLALRLLPPGQAAAQLERAIASASETARIVGLPQLDAVAWAFPADYRMPGLPRLLDMDWITEHVVPRLTTEALGGPDALTVVQYAPEQSCTVRLDLNIHESGGSSKALVFYGKHHAAEEAGDAALVLSTLSAQARPDFGIAPITLAQPEFGIQWQATAAGMQIQPVTLFDPAGNALRQIAQATAALHATPAPELRRGSVFDFAELDMRLQSARCLPAFAQRELANSVRNLSRAPIESASPLCLCHGDLHPKNIFIAGDKVTFIDFDAAVLAPPEYDVASFAAALIYHGVQAGIDSSSIEHVVARWKEAYREAGGRLDHVAVDWLTTYCLLNERVYRCLTRLKPGRRKTAERLVAFAHSRMQEMAHA